MKFRNLIVALSLIIVNIAIAQNAKNHSLSLVASAKATQKLQSPTFPFGRCGLVQAGRRRVKCSYKNDLKKGGKISSSWLYFHVTATIPITHHYND